MHSKFDDLKWESSDIVENMMKNKLIDKLETVMYTEIFFTENTRKCRNGKIIYRNFSNAAIVNNMFRLLVKHNVTLPNKRHNAGDNHVRPCIKIIIILKTN